MPQTTGTVTIGGRPVSISGVSRETLVLNAQPAFPRLANTKNELLRVTATVRGRFNDRVTFAVGELDLAFGNHPALLALSQNGRPLEDGPSWSYPASACRCASSDRSRK